MWIPRTGSVLLTLFAHVADARGDRHVRRHGILRPSAVARIGIRAALGATLRTTLSYVVSDTAAGAVRHCPGLTMAWFSGARWQIAVGVAPGDP